MMALEARYQMAWWARLVARGQGFAWEMIQNYPGRNYDPPTWESARGSAERVGLRDKISRVDSHQRISDAGYGRSETEN